MDKRELIKEQIKVEAEFAKEHNCKCENTELRKRTIKNGAIQYVFQCLNCGSAESKAIKKSDAELLNGSDIFIPFDDDLVINYKEKYKSGRDEISKKYDVLITKAKELNEQKNDEFFITYNKYLKSEEWAEKREKVLKRANYICEGCLKNKATIAHHTTYKHVFNELMFELIAVCNSCHSFIHKDDKQPNKI